MMRNQPPGFRWLVGGFALAATVAFGFQYRSTDEPTDLILGVLCLVVAGYWLIFDREPAADGSGGDDMAHDYRAEEYLASDHAVGDHMSVDGKSPADQRPDHRGPDSSR